MSDWLAKQGWGEVFLDLEPSALAPGQRWRDELRKAGERCSAVVVLISPHWAASKWCLTEFLFAAQLGKDIFPVLIAPCSLSELPIELTATYQFADISTAGTVSRGLSAYVSGCCAQGSTPTPSGGRRRTSRIAPSFAACGCWRNRMPPSSLAGTPKSPRHSIASGGCVMARRSGCWSSSGLRARGNRVSCGRASSRA